MGLNNSGFQRTQAQKRLLKRTVPVVSKVSPVVTPAPPLNLNLSATGPIMSQVPMEAPTPWLKGPAPVRRSATALNSLPASAQDIVFDIPPLSIDLTGGQRSPGLLPQYTPPGQAPTDLPFPQPVPVNHTAIAAFGGAGLLFFGVGLYLVLKRK